MKEFSIHRCKNSLTVQSVYNNVWEMLRKRQRQDSNENNGFSLL